MARVERIVMHNGRRKRVFVGEVFPQKESITSPIKVFSSGDSFRHCGDVSGMIPSFGNTGNTEGMFQRAIRACGWDTKKDLKTCHGRGHDPRRKRVKNMSRRRAARMKQSERVIQEERETIEEQISA